VKSERRSELLATLVDHLLEQGLAEASLRPLAAAAGTNARMLMYHFNSKEELLAEAMEEARRRHLEALAVWRESDRGGGRDVLSSFWSWCSSRRMEPYVRLSLEAEALAGQGRQELRQIAARMNADWATAIEERLSSAPTPLSRRRAVATAATAGFRGLLLTLSVTGERTRLNAAAHELATRLL
jgi:AcrR family transcriptional regulator